MLPGPCGQQRLPSPQRLPAQLGELETDSSALYPDPRLLAASLTLPYLPAAL